MLSTILVRTARKLGRDTAALHWRTPSHVYNPLEYAWAGHHEYLTRYGNRTGRVLLVGMNPGPWGMAQTGVPFGNISAVRDWFQIEVRLSRKLPVQHPKYPILGMRCHRDEGSGKRVWGWAQDRFGTPDAFFDRFFVWNYCPLLLLAKNRNLPPTGLKVSEAMALAEVCDAALVRAIKALQPVAVVGIGRWATAKVESVVGDKIPTAYLPHPSPASPAANRDWPGLAEAALAPWLPKKTHRHRRS